MFKKIISICIAIAIVLSTIFFASSAKASTLTDQIDALKHQIAELTGQLNSLEQRSELATVTLVKQPTLSLSYNASQKEASLMGQFEVKIVAHKEIKIAPNGFSFQGFDGKHWIYYKTATEEVNSVNGYKMKAGEEKTFTLKAYFTPNQMFAGSYKVKLAYVYIMTSETDVLSLIPERDEYTNIVTIIGERAPYVTQISDGKFKPGDSFTIVGDRINDAVTIVDSATTSLKITNHTNGKISFQVPNLQAGSYRLELANASGVSNAVYFEVTGFTTTKTTDTYKKTVKLSDGSRFACNVGDTLDTSKTGGKCSGTGCVKGIIVNSITAKSGLVSAQKTLLNYNIVKAGGINNVTYSSGKDSNGASLKIKSGYDFKGLVDINATVYCKSVETKRTACVAEGQTYNASTPNGGSTCCPGLVAEYTGGTNPAEVGAPTMCVKPQATLNITSPNGGETYKTGDVMKIKWNSTNIPSDKVMSIGVTKKGSDIYATTITEGYCKASGGCIPVSQGYMDYKIPNTLSSGEYKLTAYCFDKNSEVSNCGAKDESNYFTINSTVTPKLNSAAYVSGKDTAVVYGENLQNVYELNFHGTIVGKDKFTFQTDKQISFVPPTYKSGSYEIGAATANSKSNLVTLVMASANPIACLSGTGPLAQGQTRCASTPTVTQTNMTPTLAAPTPTTNTQATTPTQSTASPTLTPTVPTETYSTYYIHVRQADGSRWKCNTGDVMDTTKGGTTKCSGTGCIKGIYVHDTSGSAVTRAFEVSTNGANLREGDAVNSSAWINATIYCKHKVTVSSAEEFHVTQVANVVSAGEYVVDMLKEFVKNII